MSSKLLVRPATNEDAEGILLAHYAAVHETAARDYPEDVLREWSKPVTPERIANYINKALKSETTLVAEIDGVIAGFGAIVESINELRAVYVHAGFGARGVGSALLQALEQLARERGCTELRMHSSLSAEQFYKKHGFAEVGRGFHTMSTGLKMPCVMMQKIL